MSSKLTIVILRTLLLLAFFVMWHLSQVAISDYKDHLVFKGGIVDQVHVLTDPINAYLNEHRQVSTFLLILTSIEVDVLTLFIFLYSIFSSSARLVIGLTILMLLRQLCEMIVLLPLPPGILWYDTHFPTLFVTYNIKNDFFFSGHTALVIYAATALGDLFKSKKYIGFLRWGLIIFQCTVILLLRAHYFMDVFTAFFTALVVYNFVHKIKLPYWLDTNTLDSHSSEKESSKKKLKKSAQ